jgi:hypothetical protein
VGKAVPLPGDTWHDLAPHLYGLSERQQCLAVAVEHSPEADAEIVQRPSQFSRGGGAVKLAPDVSGLPGDGDRLPSPIGPVQMVREVPQRKGEAIAVGFAFTG